MNRDSLKSFQLENTDTAPSTATDKLFELYESSESVNEKIFRSILMKSMFLTRTRPLYEVTDCVLKYKNARTDSSRHEKFIYYLNGSKKCQTNSLNLYCSSDASFASHKDLQRFKSKGHTGVTMSIGNNNVPFHSSSKKQRFVTKSRA